MRSSARTSLLVANPTAQTGKAESAIEAAMRGLDAAGLEPEFFPTQPDGATVKALASRLEADDIARVVYLGGDGTFAESAKGLILARELYGVDIPLGMLPMGTANDQGRSFGILAGAGALTKNIAVVAAGIEQWLDVGRIEAFDEHGESLRQDLWFDNCGFGLSAKVLAQRNRDRDWVEKVPVIRRFYRDKVLYTGATFATFFKSIVAGKRFSVQVEVDGEVHEHTGLTDLVINGTLLYGGDWIFAPDGKPDDGRFEVLTFKSHADWVGAAIRSHKRNPVTDDDREVVGLQPRPYVQGKEIKVRIFRPQGADPVPAQIDGEEFPAADHYRIDNLFHHMRIIVPEDASWV